MTLTSVTGIGERDVAGVPAVRTVVEAVGAQADFVLPLAYGAVLLTDALVFWLVASCAKDRSRHGKPPAKLYLTEV
jgi:hypothetical protein